MNYEKLEPFAKEIQNEYYNNTWIDNKTIAEIIQRIEESRLSTEAHNIS